jgi:hypothetical protein
MRSTQMSDFNSTNIWLEPTMCRALGKALKIEMNETAFMLKKVIICVIWE